mmetsp:Transcript_36447/g.114669  ORF Transcript_36447/g.114669 Transcript_36447/m.114669 type:complete len:81 (+) Transcript_36447:215-457(+)
MCDPPFLPPSLSLSLSFAASLLPSLYLALSRSTSLSLRSCYWQTLTVALTVPPLVCLAVSRIALVHAPYVQDPGPANAEV